MVMPAGKDEFDLSPDPEEAGAPALEAGVEEEDLDQITFLLDEDEESGEVSPAQGEVKPGLEVQVEEQPEDDKATIRAQIEERVLSRMRQGRELFDKPAEYQAFRKSISSYERRILDGIKSERDAVLEPYRRSEEERTWATHAEMLNLYASDNWAWRERMASPAAARHWGEMLQIKATLGLPLDADAQATRRAFNAYNARFTQAAPADTGNDDLDDWLDDLHERDSWKALSKEEQAQFDPDKLQGRTTVQKIAAAERLYGRIEAQAEARSKRSSTGSAPAQNVTSIDTAKKARAASAKAAPVPQSGGRPGISITYKQAQANYAKTGSERDYQILRRAKEARERASSR